ncbi:MAG: DUF3995 domain-containing protein [Hyphomicrobiaceae bacterium]|nr:DUF3995 domain-containing protein [Hyphomicrobiaceae bacterium]MCC0024933.1 DUF3995 domain-containing protein [Hyphomicrobiaceae bacterium]
MLAGIASLVFVPLLTIAIAHLMWSFGAKFPAQDEAMLAKTVVGRPGIEKMPSRWMSFLVALFALAAGIWALSLSDPTPDLILDIGGVGLALVFLARGIAGFTSGWRQRFPEEPFRTFDRKLYSPLSLAIGLGFALLTLLNAAPF